MNFSQIYKKRKAIFNTREQVREYFYALCDFLKLPHVKVYVLNRRGEDDIQYLHGYFMLGRKNSPYVVIYSTGWDRGTVKHELIHFAQYVQDGHNRFFEEKYGEHYEQEAQYLETFSEDELESS